MKLDASINNQPEEIKATLRNVVSRMRAIYGMSDKEIEGVFKDLAGVRGLLDQRNIEETHMKTQRFEL